MVKKGNLAVFESNDISETREVTPTKIGVDTLVIMVGKGKLAVFEGSSISETQKVTPTKIGVHACYINTYLHEFFEPIPID